MNASQRPPSFVHVRDVRQWKCTSFARADRGNYSGHGVQLADDPGHSRFSVEQQTRFVPLHAAGGAANQNETFYIQHPHRHAIIFRYVWAIVTLAMLAEAFVCKLEKSYEVTEELDFNRGADRRSPYPHD